jgi:hypothetical protein
VRFTVLAICLAAFALGACEQKPVVHTAQFYVENDKEREETVKQCKALKTEGNEATRRNCENAMTAAFVVANKRGTIGTVSPKPSSQK